MGSSQEPSRWRARIPADVDRPEPVAAGLTGRQLVILAPVAAGLWGAYWALKDAVELWILGAAAVPVAAVALVAALGTRDGLSLDRLLGAAVAWGMSPKHLVAAPGGQVGPLPRWAPRAARTPALAPLRLPASAIADSGVIDLGDRQAALILCTTVNFGLASGAEQDAMVGALAGVLDSFTHPAQILVRGERIDLAPFTHQLRANADELPHASLRDAARAHAEFLDRLQLQRELLQRQVSVAVTVPGRGAKAAAAVRRRAEETAAQLTALGVKTAVCDGEQAARLVRASLTPLTLTPPSTSEDTDTAEQ